MWQRSLLAPLDVVIAFFTARAQLARLWPKVTDAADAGRRASWVAWPKRRAGSPTDVTEDVLRAELLPTGWVDNKVCAIDDAVERPALRAAQGAAPRAKEPSDRATRSASIDAA